MWRKIVALAAGAVAQIAGSGDLDGGELSPREDAAGPAHRPAGMPRHRFAPRREKDSTWWLDYVELQQRLANDPEQEMRQTRHTVKKFRRRFRMPVEVFEDIVRICEEHGLGTKKEGRGRRPKELVLKVMGVLRVLGRAHCFDDVEESTNISAEVHRCFFHRFCEIFATKVASAWLRPPESRNEVLAVFTMYGAVGFPGCIGSIDCVHIPWERCPAADRALFTNGKEVSSGTWPRP